MSGDSHCIAELERALVDAARSRPRTRPIGFEESAFRQVVDQRLTDVGHAVVAHEAGEPLPVGRCGEQKGSEELLARGLGALLVRELDQSVEPRAKGRWNADSDPELLSRLERRVATEPHRAIVDRIRGTTVVRYIP